MTADVARFDGPSVANFTTLLTSFTFVREVEVHTGDLPFWAVEYDILCSLHPLAYHDIAFEEAERLVWTALEMAARPWRTKVKCVVREAGPGGDVKESIWRLGGGR